jgi:signal transduction histidine kinase
MIEIDHGTVSGRVDTDGRLIEADPLLASLHARAGGEPGGTLAIPQLASLVRLAARLGIVVSRGVLAADEGSDLSLWVRAQPDAGGVRLSIPRWHAQPAYVATLGDARDRDFRRAEADWRWETDGGLNLVDLSPAAAAAIGRKVDSLIGQPLTRLLRLIEAPDGALPMLVALAGQRRFHDQLAELRGQTGSRLRIAGTPMIDGAGRFAGFRGTAVSFDGAPAPDPAAPPVAPDAFGVRLDAALRVPLARIISGAESIRSQEDGPVRPDYTEYAGDIAAAGRHLLALVDDLVDLQAIERADFHPEIEAIDLADLARRAAGLLSVRAGARDVRIDRPAPDDTLPAMGEFRRTLQILVNLIGNAIRYSPDGGMVWIRIEREGDLAAVVVADQGKGIAAEDQARIFEKFERVDPGEPGGTGLGLYIARRLARAMGGEIAVDSALGQGARFVLTLPGR